MSTPSYPLLKYKQKNVHAPFARKLSHKKAVSKQEKTKGRGNGGSREVSQKQKGVPDKKLMTLKTNPIFTF